MIARFVWNARFVKAACFLGALSVFAVAGGAQTMTATAKVPFEFAAAGAMLPAGEYTLNVPDLSGVILLHGSAGNTVALLTVASQVMAPSGTAKLIFERRDGMAFLSAVEWPNQSLRVVSPSAHPVKAPVTAALR
ncbi:MAG TPA: hypothetical protein VME17_03410 [Bryobacteraceae bacterium]|nr:hypothetical protein [Bryobacteraceae bacterium]